MKTITKIKMQRIVATVTTVGLIIIGCFVIPKNKVYERNKDYFKSFFSNNYDYDVLFFGTSHMEFGILPIQLWNDFGITSYNCATSGCTTELSCESLRNVIKHAKPKYAVLDLFGRGRPNKLSWYHYLFDGLPLSATKIQSIYRVCENPKDRLELLFPFSVYHNNLTLNYKKENIGLLNGRKGCDLYFTLLPNPEKVNYTTVDKNDWLSLHENHLKHIYDFITICKENDIIPILVNLPETASETEQKYLNYIKKELEKINVSCYIFDNRLVDFYTDLSSNWDGADNSHLNISGAIKATTYMGEILRNNFNIPDHREDPAYANWNNDYEAYREFLFEQIQNYSDFDTLLMLCNNSNFKAEIFVKEDIELTTRQKKLITQLNDSIKVNYISKELEVPDIRLVVTDAKTGSTISEKKYSMKMAFQFS